MRDDKVTRSIPNTIWLSCAAAEIVLGALSFTIRLSS